MPPLAEIVPAAALLALLVTAYAHPRGRTEAAVGLVAAAATLATGATSTASLSRKRARKPTKASTTTTSTIKEPTPPAIERW